MKETDENLNGKELTEYFGNMHERNVLLVKEIFFPFLMIGLFEFFLFTLDEKSEKPIFYSWMLPAAKITLISLLVVTLSILLLEPLLLKFFRWVDERESEDVTESQPK